MTEDHLYIELIEQVEKPTDPHLKSRGNVTDAVVLWPTTEVTRTWHKVEDDCVVGEGESEAGGGGIRHQSSHEGALVV